MTRVLYLYGGWPGHRPYAVADWARPLFAELGFEVDETQDVGDFVVASEQYYMFVDPNNHVLMETVFTGEHLHWLDGHRMPQAWTRRWGAGRVFYSAIGHDIGDLANPDVTRLVQQGIAWAARRDEHATPAHPQ
jgi:type 1 glutamine amidotransferase